MCPIPTLGLCLSSLGQPVAYCSHKLSPTECNYLVTDHELLAIFPSMSAVALLPTWARVNSGLYRSQGAGASAYLATVVPPLDMLGGEASRVPLGHTVHRWPCQHCC